MRFEKSKLDLWKIETFHKLKDMSKPDSVRV